MTTTEQIVGAIADAKDIEPRNLDIILQDYIDVDAVRLLANHQNEAWQLEFAIPNHTVRILGGNAVFVDGVRRRPFSDN